MVKTLNVLGVIVIFAGLVVGIFISIYGSWWMAIASIASSVISALLLFAFAYMIDLLEANNHYLRYLYNRARDTERTKAAPAPAGNGTSRSSLDKMQGYSFKGID